ncbi:MAG: hypothetical protein QOE05_2556 [Actinomycetota bacterium]|jgi:hypothetical protein|nr:hypothetical protein [Actinomycetota bacterium]
MESFIEKTDAQLAEEILTWSGRIAAGEAHLLALIGEFDERGAWVGHGLLSCAHWMSWQLGLGLNAARERVRVARRLRELPDIAEAFAAGRMSWCQVRAVTRVASTEDGIDWPGLARNASGAQLERIVRGMRRVHRDAEADMDPDLARYRMRTRTSYDADGTLVITIRAAAEDGAVIRAGMQAMRAQINRRRAELAAAGADAAADVSAETPTDVSAETSGHEEPADATLSEALLEMARLAIEQQHAEHPDVARRTRSELFVQVDPMSGWGRLHDGEFLPPSSLRRVEKSLPGRGRLVPLRREDLTRHDLGRTRREPSLALRELLGTVDGERCRFPGCTRHRKLHAHHVVYWSRDGETNLDNMILLCSRHHTIVHQQHFQLVLHPDRRLEVATSEVARVLHHPALPWGDRERLESSARLARDATDARMDLGYVVNVLLHQAA